MRRVGWRRTAWAEAGSAAGSDMVVGLELGLEGGKVEVWAEVVVVLGVGLEGLAMVEVPGLGLVAGKVGAWVVVVD